jgi:hypothetical protein
VKILPPQDPEKWIDEEDGGKEVAQSLYSFAWNAIQEQFRQKAGLGWDYSCDLCDELGILQIAKSTVRFNGFFFTAALAEELNTYDWKLDKKFPYPFVKGKNTIIFPAWRSVGAIFTDTPGVPIHSWVGTTLLYLKQDFELHIVCLAGKEKGATYGGYKWGHTFEIKGLGEYLHGADVDGYDYKSYSHPIKGRASEKWIEIYNEATRQ